MEDDDWETHLGVSSDLDTEDDRFAEMCVLVGLISVVVIFVVVPLL